MGYMRGLSIFARLPANVTAPGAIWTTAPAYHSSTLIIACFQSDIRLSFLVLQILETVTDVELQDTVIAQFMDDGNELFPCAEGDTLNAAYPVGMGEIFRLGIDAEIGHEKRRPHYNYSPDSPSFFSLFQSIRFPLKLASTVLIRPLDNSHSLANAEKSANAALTSSMILLLAFSLRLQ